MTQETLAEYLNTTKMIVIKILFEFGTFNTHTKYVCVLFFT